MFKELAPIAHTTMIQILISGEENGQLRVNIMPKAIEGQNPALSTPLSLLATPEELDEQLPSILTGYVGTRQSLADSLESARIVMESAKKDALKKTTKAAASPKAAAVADSDGVDLRDDEPFDEETGDDVGSHTASANSAAVKTDDLNLFG
jgi:PRTRC genetic system protein E